MLLGKFQGLVKPKKSNRYPSKEKQIIRFCTIKISFLQHIDKHVYLKTILLHTILGWCLMSNPFGIFLLIFMSQYLTSSYMFQEIKYGG